MGLSSRKNYWSLDIAKFICAILVISAHFAAEWGAFPTIIDYAFSLYVIAVPFFFACSGFLFFKKWLPMDQKNRKHYLASYQKRIWIMYGCWTAVYFPFKILSWVRKGTLLNGFLNWLHTALVFQTYATIWFLPALAIGIAVTCYLVSRFSKRTILLISALLYIFGMLGYTYKFLIDGTVIGQAMDLYLLVFITSRNGLFNAVPLITLGLVLSQTEIIPSNRAFIKNGLLSTISLLLIVVEAFFLKMKFTVTGMDISIFLLPFTYFFFMTLLNIEIRGNALWLWCRKLSLLMFVSQRLFLSALPSVFPSLFGTFYSNSYTGLAIVLCLILSFSVIFIQLGERVKFLKHFV